MAPYSEWTLCLLGKPTQYRSCESGSISKHFEFIIQCAATNIFVLFYLFRAEKDAGEKEVRYLIHALFHVSIVYNISTLPNKACFLCCKMMTKCILQFINKMIIFCFVLFLLKTSMNIFVKVLKWLMCQYLLPFKKPFGFDHVRVHEEGQVFFRC